jgi:hypothetical protein
MTRHVALRRFEGNGLLPRGLRLGFAPSGPVGKTRTVGDVTIMPRIRFPEGEEAKLPRKAPPDRAERIAGGIAAMRPSERRVTPSRKV